MIPQIYTTHINSLTTDFKASSIIAAILEEGEMQDDLVEIVPSGPDRSVYAKEIKGVEHYYSETLMQDRVVIKVNREGFYDMLPEGLFHRIPKYKDRMTKEEMIAHVRERREEEKFARQFFMPFEAALYHLRMLLDLYENRLDKRSSYRDLAKLFVPLWPEFATLDNEQCIVWMHLIPYIPHKRNDLSFLESAIEALFNVRGKVICQTQCTIKTEIPPAHQFALGNGYLGVDTIIGRHFMHQEDKVRILMGPAPIEKLLCFLPQQSNRRTLDTLCHYLLPIDTAVELQLSYLPGDRVGSLGKDSKYALLGYTAHLSIDQD
uniref:Type VI secretion system baseplate subunit TssG n=1 Tax=Sphingobacterium sp. (strain 21) TaxID=743722 RepID=F4C6C1_SPHS2